MQVREVRDLICAKRATDTGVVGPSVDIRIIEGAIKHELPAAFEEVEQRDPSLRTFEDVPFLNRNPRHPPPRGCQRIARAGMLLLFDQHLLPRLLPFLRRYYRRLLQHCDLLIARHDAASHCDSPWMDLVRFHWRRVSSELS